jgi:hypothetical protein
MKRSYCILRAAMSVGVILAIVALCFTPGVSSACFANFQTGCITNQVSCYIQCYDAGCSWCNSECGSGFLYVGYSDEDTSSCSSEQHNCICIDECGGDPC